MKKSRFSADERARSGYVLVVGGILAMVTFTLIFLTTLPFAGSF